MSFWAWIFVIAIVLGVIAYMNPDLINFEKEIDTGEKNCREVMTGMFGAMMDTLADSDCSNLCQAEGYSYKQWKCSKNDTIVCVCNR